MVVEEVGMVVEEDACRYTIASLFEYCTCWRGVESGCGAAPGAPAAPSASVASSPGCGQSACSQMCGG